jgi:hypothetical protein
MNCAKHLDRGDYLSEGSPMSQYPAEIIFLVTEAVRQFRPLAQESKVESYWNDKIEQHFAEMSPDMLVTEILQIFRFILSVLVKNYLMKEITREQYEFAERRIEELLPLVNDNTPIDDPLRRELVRMSDLVEQYEKFYYPIGPSDGSEGSE